MFSIKINQMQRFMIVVENGGAWDVSCVPINKI